jgi:hypothetical protein
MDFRRGIVALSRELRGNFAALSCRFRSNYALRTPDINFSISVYKFITFYKNHYHP